ncbi:MAG: 3'-5' exonuclease [Gammaproteobacteria bacterium]
MALRKHLFSLESRRQWWLNRVPEGPLRSYYSVPFPDGKADWRRVDYLAIDFETTGLDPRREEILSVGYVAIRNQSIQLGESCHALIRPQRDIPEASAVVHGILDDRAQTAESITTVLPQVLRALAGKVLVAHHAAIEYEFLNEVCKRLYGYPFVGPVVDTLELEARLYRSRDQVIKPGELRLATARGRYGLPRYPAHNALTDAIACGELFLAQAAYRAGKRHPTLKELLAKS